MAFLRFSKKGLAAAAVALMAFSAFAIDFGGALRNSTKLKGKSFSSIKLDQVDDLNLWVKVPLSKDGKMYFTAEGLYEFEADDSTVYNRLDLDLCKFAAQFKFDQNTLNVSAGRFIYSDLTGIIFSQNADGAFASYTTSKFSVSAYAAYTGLLNAALVKMLDNSKDRFTYDSKAVYELAQKYFVAAASFTLPCVAASQSLSFQALGTFKVEGKSYNRIYATATIGGPIYNTIFYNFSTTMEMQSFDGGSMDLSNLTSANVSWFLPYKDLTLNGGVLYASGSHGPFEAFRGFTKREAYNAFNEPQHSGLIKFSFSANAKPLKPLLVSAGFDVIIAAATSSMDYKGFQYALGADWQILSDVKAGLNFLQYIDKSDSDLNKVQISLNAAITF